MKKTYAQVVRQIASLQAEAEKLRRDEIGGVITRIRDAIQHYGLSAADLGLGNAGVGAPTATGKPRGKPGRKPGKAKSAAVRVVKFRNDSGGTWGGRGKRPQWLRDALAGGKTLQDFAV
ncbi:MAG: H-NS histone family protein [Chitinophagaceae bacterium]|nr:H-NS histone family protein [Rubrivivax sp.]